MSVGRWFFMNQTATIRSKLEGYIKSEGVTLQRLAENSSINPGTLSAILHANRPIAMRQLDNLTAGMGLPEGDLYEMYVTECLIDHTPNWRRLRPFLYRCAEMDKLHCIEQVISHIMDNLAYVPLLFEAAEDLFEQGKHKVARILYESVAESERYQHSERLAVCQYRLFTMSVGLDQQANLRAAVIFEAYVDRLCEVDQLDALRQLANVYYSLRQWKKVYNFSIEMGKKALILYSFKSSKKNKEQEKKPPRPVFSYIFYSYLLQSSVHFEKNNFEQALYFISLYADTSWVKENEEIDKFYKARFQKWAVANSYMCKIMSGDFTVLSDYINFMKTNDNEALIALMSVMEAANRYDYDVDYLLLLYKDDIDSLVKLSTYNVHLNEFRYIKLYLELAAYYFRRYRFADGIKSTMICLDSAVKNNSTETVIRCVSLFEKNRQHASSKDVDYYQYLIEEVEKKNEEARLDSNC
jgi:transcriptional regulator with XRE-family HTH domain